MFKRRIRVAGVVFVAIAVLTFFCIVWWKVSEKYSTGTGELKVLTGSLDMVEGVKISLGVAERVWDTDEVSYERKTAVKKADYFYQTRTAQIAGETVETRLKYKREKGTELKNRMLFCGFSPEFPQKAVKGIHLVKGKEFSYNLKWYLTDGYTYYGEEKYLLPAYVTFGSEDSFYYEGLGPEYYEEFALPLFGDDVSHYEGRFLCELAGKLYGYPVVEPEKDFGASEVHMTVKEGVYRFDENGTAECVFPMGERGDGFSFLWLIGKEENHTLTVIGAKENKLLAYTYYVDSDTVEETVLWKDGEDFSAWTEAADMCTKADFMTVGERMYLCYTDIDFNKVRLAVFEDGQRIFEGELLEREYEPDGLRDFSANTNGEVWKNSVLDKLEISSVK